jgi:hypothetical protein
LSYLSYLTQLTIRASIPDKAIDGQRMSVKVEKRSNSEPRSFMEQLLASAAGAIMEADGVEQLLTIPDAEVGRLLKQKIRTYRKHLHLHRPEKSRVSEGWPVLEAVPPPSKATLGKQALEARRRLVQTGQLLESSQLRDALQMTRQAVSAATRVNRLFTVDVDGRAYYPAFFTDGTVDRNVLERISRALGQLPGWSKWDFFVSRWGSLGDLSPLEALAKGRVEQVEKVAHGFYEELQP